MNKKIFLLFALLFVSKNSFTLLGINNHYNQFMEWWQGDQISIESNHSKIFKKHIKVRGWDNAEKKSEKENFIVAIKDEKFVGFVDGTIEKLKQYDNTIKKMARDKDFSLYDFEDGLVEEIKNNLDKIVKILSNYKKNFKNKDGSIIDVKDKNFVRLIKFLPIVENLYQIFSLILACKDTQLSLINVYNLFEENIPANRARFYIKLVDDFDELVEYARSSVSITKINQYQINKENLNQVYNTVLNNIVSSHLDSLRQYDFEESGIIELIKQGAHPEQLKQFLKLNLKREQAINFAKKYNMTPETISLLSRKEKS
ncbi:MAG: hypothetical protein ABIA74_05520 [bacterium]